MVAFLTRMPAGIAGSLSRGVGQATVEPQMITLPGITNAPSAYGQFGVIDASTGKFRVPISTDTRVYGGFVRPYPGSSGQDGLGTTTPAPVGGRGDIMKRGYMSVLLGGATAAAKDGRVYIRKANAVTGKPIGGVEAAADVAAVGAVNGGNTGNGTIGTVSATDVADDGVYAVTMLTATTYRVVDPLATRLPDGATGTPYVQDGVTFTVTVGGTPMVAGDGFTVTVTKSTITLLATSYFTGPADASGDTEVAFNI